MCKKRSGIPGICCMLVYLTGTFQCAIAQLRIPSDTLATSETRALLNSLDRLRGKGCLFGHQDDLAYGTTWKYEAGRSDIRDVTGDYPAVYGWDLGGIETGQPVNLDSVPFESIKKFIETVYARGGINTISWHLRNPLTGKTAWEPSEGTVEAILPGGSHHKIFTAWLDKVADFLLQLKGPDGEFIPVIFRPFHELNGNWFWWGGDHAQPEAFRQLWIFTTTYLRETRHVHHLLYAYNTDRFNSADAYLLKYPGNDWVDILGFDIYQRESSGLQYNKDIEQMLQNLESIAAEKHKIPALTEFGGNLKEADWWTKVFLTILRQHRLAYVLAWRNAGLKHNGEFEYYVPYKGELTENDFKIFYKDRITLFQSDISVQSVYR